MGVEKIEKQPGRCGLGSKNLLERRRKTQKITENPGPGGPPADPAKQAPFGSRVVLSWLGVQGGCGENRKTTRALRFGL